MSQFQLQNTSYQQSADNNLRFKCRLWVSAQRILPHVRSIYICRTSRAARARKNTRESKENVAKNVQIIMVDSESKCSGERLAPLPATQVAWVRTLIPAGPAISYFL
jgi:hypothetical protein